jgi:inward rectifier potassium channel
MTTRPASRRGARVELGRLAFIRLGTSVVDLRDPYGFAIGLGWRGFALLFVALEVGINALFGALYVAVPGCVANLPTGSFLNAFFFSVETLATVGYGVMAPVTPYGHIISGIEIICGTAFTAIMTGLTFVRFSRARARILYARHMVVARHNGVPTLMLRLANARAGLVTSATARLTVLLPEHTREGQTFRRTFDLHLTRPHSPLFAITWTVMHPIGPTSPLHGLGIQELREAGARFFFTVVAWDVRLGAEIHDLRDYGADEILVGQRFVDVVTFDETGVPVADFSRISEVEPDLAWDATDEAPREADPPSVAPSIS